MTKTLPVLVFLILFNLTLTAQNCLESAKIVPPALTDSARQTYLARLAEAKEKFDENPNSAETTIWLGRRIAYLGNYRDAIRIFTRGLEKFPNDARFYRHRGHRYLTIRCFDDALRDFEAAAKLVKGKPDEIEPDGLPNARNTPTSTLQSNIFYHLGLAYYLKGDFENALKSFKLCEKVSANPDLLVATKHWLFMTLRRLERPKDAERAVEDVKDNLDIIENADYYRLVKLYQGKLRADLLLAEIDAQPDSLSNASLGYGLGNWFLTNGERERAQKIFRRITAGNQWASFGFIAAEAELKR